ncbi:MAG: toll/interleukin-1 receptor domain-containing protein [Bacteroidota bacterium]
MVNINKRKIGFSSRYYEPFRLLQGRLSSKSAFKLVHNSEKGTYSFPYLYHGYKHDIDPISVANKIIQSIKQYFEDNLFNTDEKKLLLTELMPYVQNYGNDTINSLNKWIDLAKREEYSEKILEYEKTITSMMQINDLLCREFNIEKFMTNANEPVVFISYSHDSDEHKNWVLQLATRLRKNGVDVILDRWNIKLGSDLASFMERGLSKSQRIVSVCSDAYVRKANEGKGGAGYEKQIMTSEFINDQNTNWVIPLIKNNPNERKTPTFLGGRMCISFEEPHLYESKYEELLRDILDEPVLPIPEIGKNPFQTIKEFAQQKFIPNSEKYVSPATRGKVTFDYSNNNGHYFIGQGELMFELVFLKSSNENIQLYNSPNSIHTVAVVKNETEISSIKDARIYDGSSRVRRPNINQIAVLQNNNGFYAAVKILDLKDGRRMDENDEVTFEYIIQTNGSPDFSM